MFCTVWCCICSYDMICYSSTDCFGRAQTQSLWGQSGWSSEGWGSGLQEDPLESRGCSRKECPYQLLGGCCYLFCIFFFVAVTSLWLMRPSFFREWISQQISWGLLYASGRHWLRLMLMWRQLTVTPFACSALDSLRSVLISRKEPAMRSPVRFARLVIFLSYFLVAKPVLVRNGINLICFFSDSP